MTALRIFDELSGFPEGPDARNAAQAGFLEWVLTLPDGASAQMAASDALGRIALVESGGSAAALFLKYLRDAARMPAPAPVRRGGRGAKLVLRH